MIVVSACLAGIKCNWEGKAKPCKEVIELIKKGKTITVCPEQLGGLPTPRIPAEQKNNKIVNKEGKDVTSEFNKGAELALKITLNNKCNKVILKSKSPSCGCNQIYDGTFTGKLTKGDGVFTKLLKEKNIPVITEKEL
jgi:uncharacterized protein YbbK (DUF523 family)